MRGQDIYILNLSERATLYGPFGLRGSRVEKILVQK